MLTTKINPELRDKTSAFAILEKLDKLCANQKLQTCKEPLQVMVNESFGSIGSMLAVNALVELLTDLNTQFGETLTVEEVDHTLAVLSATAQIVHQTVEGK